VRQPLLQRFVCTDISKHMTPYRGGHVLVTCAGGAWAVLVEVLAPALVAAYSTTVLFLTFGRFSFEQDYSAYMCCIFALQAAIWNRNDLLVYLLRTGRALLQSRGSHRLSMFRLCHIGTAFILWQTAGFAANAT